MTVTDKDAAIKMLRLVADAVTESVNHCPNGMPGGTLYAALMTHGCSLETFNQIMDGLVSAGRIDKRGQLYFPRGAK